MIVVTGMHRSGTSLFAQLLLMFGVDFGRPSEFSQTEHCFEQGYTEYEEIIDLNSELITGFPRHRKGFASVASKLIYTTMPSQAAIMKRAESKKEQLLAIGAKYDKCAVKDVRFCLTLAVWKKIVPIEKFVVCLRHPTEVALSLKKRQHYPIWLGYMFWNYHIRSLLEQLETEKTLFVNFSSLREASSEEEIMRMANFFSIRKPKSELLEIRRNPPTGNEKALGTACPFL
jgi:hypothetical protein